MAIFYIQCWGCRKEVSREFSSPSDYDEKTSELRNIGWRQRRFAPNASPYFCSEECATNSFHARQAEEYWKNKLNTQIHSSFDDFICLLPILLFAGVLILAACVGIYFG